MSEAEEKPVEVEVSEEEKPQDDSKEDTGIEKDIENLSVEEKKPEEEIGKYTSNICRIIYNIPIY